MEADRIVATVAGGVLGGALAAMLHVAGKLNAEGLLELLRAVLALLA